MFKASKSKKIFGIGLPKTGTTSLSEALEILGYSSVHYPKSLSEIEGYDSATDSLVAINYKLLDRQYPGSKFVLTLRSFDEWIDSIERHLSKLSVPKVNSTAYMLREKSIGSAVFNRSKHNRAHKQHVKKVRRYFKHRPQDLLEIDFSQTGEQWKPLCEFLNIREVPDAAFPHRNIDSSDSIRAKNTR